MEFPAIHVYSPASSKETFLTYKTSISSSVMLTPAAWKRGKAKKKREKATPNEKEIHVEQAQEIFYSWRGIQTSQDLPCVPPRPSPKTQHTKESPRKNILEM